MAWERATHFTAESITPWPIHTETNSSNSSNGCDTFSSKQIHDMTMTKAILAAIAVAMCLLGIIVIIVLKQYRTFVHRLVIYLMVIALFQGIFTFSDMLPVHHTGNVAEIRPGWNDVCIAIAFGIQVTLSQLMMVFIWILVYLVLLAVFKYRANSKKHEIAGLIFTLGLPLVFNWIPFIHNMYGLAGAWCWIRITNKDCQTIHLGIIYQFTLCYGPLSLLMLFSFVLFSVIVATVGKRSFDHSRGATPSQRSPYQQALKQSLPLLVYPVIYSLIVGVMVVNRVHYAVTTAQGKGPYYPLWFAHTVADPLRVLFIPLAFVLHPGTVKKLLALRRGRHTESSDSETAYHVPPEPSYSEVEPLVIKGTHTTRPGTVYRSIFESDSGIQS